MRRNTLEALDEVLTALENTKAERAQEVQKHFHEEIEKYRDQQKDIQTEARGLRPRSTRHPSRRPLRSRRGISADCAGRYFDHAAHRQSQILVFGHRTGLCGNDCRRQRIPGALKLVWQTPGAFNAGVLECLSDIFPLRSMPNGVDGNALLLHAIQHDVRCASDDEFPDTWLGQPCPGADDL